MQVEHFDDAISHAVRTLASGLDHDWSQPAGTLTWTCRETADHVVDVLFSYALQLATETKTAYLPYDILHALPEARPGDIVDAMGGVGTMFVAVMSRAPDARAWHPFGVLSVTEWAGLGANEVVVHTFDIAAGLSIAFDPPAALCAEILDDMLALHGRTDASNLGDDPCSALLTLSGR
jgi:hypothetical protein